jgi:hypothetical protein
VKGIDIAHQIVDTKTCHLVRPRKDEPGEYDAKPLFTGNKRGWFYFDLFSASAVVQVYNALSPEAQAKYSLMSPPVMVDVAFKVLKKAAA